GIPVEGPTRAEPRPGGGPAGRGTAAVHRALRRLPPGGRRRRRGDGRARAADPARPSPGDRGGGPHGSVRDARLLPAGHQRQPARLDHRVRAVRRPARPRRVGNRPHRPDPRGDGHLVHRGRGPDRGVRNPRHEVEGRMRRLLRWLTAWVLLLFRGRRKEEDGGERMVPDAPSNRGSETVVAMLLFACAGCAIAFVVFYAIDRLGRNTQVMGLALGGALIFLALALMVTAARL